MLQNALPTEDYVVFSDRNKALRDLTKRMLFMLPLLLPFFVLAYYFAHGFKVPVHAITPPYTVRYVQVPLPPALTVVMTLAPWFILTEFVFVYLIARRALKKRTKPLIVLSSQGIQISAPAMHFGLIPWNEIEEVRSYRFIYRSIGIVPKSAPHLIRQMKGSSAWLFRLCAACVPLYGFFGIFVAPISIAETYLSVSADELLSHIQTYRAAYHKRGDQFHPGLELPAAEGTWPPPPRNEERHR